MDCENIKEKISLYIDNLLDSDEVAQIREHIDSCDSCRAYYNKLLKLGQMVDDFRLTDNEEHWELQKNKVIEQIEKAESEKIIKVQSWHKPNRFFKYLAVAASLALVAFVSIYESQDYNHIKGLFDDSDMDVSTKQKIESDSTKDISIRGGRSGEVSFDTTALSEEAEKTISTEKLSQQEAVESDTPPKKRVEKAHAVDEDKKVVTESEQPEPPPLISMPEPEPSLQLGEPAEVSYNSGDLESVQTSLRPAGLPSQSEEVKPLSIKIDAKKEKDDLSQVERQSVNKKGIRLNDIANEKAASSFHSEEGQDYQQKPPIETDLTDTEFNIYEIRLDSLEEEYPGIYSPHYIESSAKGQGGIAPDSLDIIVLEIAETCFQVGILTLDENMREEMINKLQQLSIHGSPEAIEKIQRYIVMLLAAD